MLAPTWQRAGCRDLPYVEWSAACVAPDPPLMRLRARRAPDAHRAAQPMPPDHLDGRTHTAVELVVGLPCATLLTGSASLISPGVGKTTSPSAWRIASAERGRRACYGTLAG